MKRAICWLGTGMGILLLLITVAYASEEDVPLDKVPKPVMEAVKARFKDAEVTGAAKEPDDDGQLVYEISLKVDGQNVDVVMAPEGNIRLIEKTIADKDLPRAVSKALKHNYPKATYKRFEEITLVEGEKESLSYYEVRLVTARKRNVEVEIAVNGKIVKENKTSR